MIDLEKWDWETPVKEIPLNEWKGTFRWVEEPHASPDGERIAAIVNMDEGEFSVWVNGHTWENYGRMTAIVSEMGQGPTSPGKTITRLSIVYSRSF